MYRIFRRSRRCFHFPAAAFELSIIGSEKCIVEKLNTRLPEKTCGLMIPRPVRRRDKTGPGIEITAIAARRGLTIRDWSVTFQKWNSFGKI
jgi:hypothetical protein